MQLFSFKSTYWNI